MHIYIIETQSMSIANHIISVGCSSRVCRHGSLGVMPLASLYLTPPMSEERICPFVGRSEFDTPLPSYPFRQPDLTAAEDLVSMFYKNGFPIITQHILQFLSPEDVYSASLVCKSWRGIIDNLPTIRKKLNEYQCWGGECSDYTWRALHGATECPSQHPECDDCPGVHTQVLKEYSSAVSQRCLPLAHTLSKLHLSCPHPLLIRGQVHPVWT